MQDLLFSLLNDLLAGCVQSYYNFYGGDFISTVNPLARAFKIILSISIMLHIMHLVVQCASRTRTLTCLLCVSYGESHECGHYCVISFSFSFFLKTPGIFCELSSSSTFFMLIHAVHLVNIFCAEIAVHETHSYWKHNRIPRLHHYLFEKDFSSKNKTTEQVKKRQKWGNNKTGNGKVNSLDLSRFFIQLFFFLTNTQFLIVEP